MNHRIIAIWNLLLFTCILCSCKKLVEVDGPITSVSSQNAYNNDGTAIGAVTSLYVNLTPNLVFSPFELTGLSVVAGLSADELTYYNSAANSIMARYYRNSLTSLNSGGGGDYWAIAYKRIYAINSALEGLTASRGLNSSVKQQLLGEVRFMRAFYYFYLVNLYGEVPLVLSTDYTINAVIRKSQKTDIYTQIIIDLKEAQALLSDRYLKGDLINAYPVGKEERVRPTKWAATALLGRTYLFLNDWASAKIQTSIVLTNTTQFHLEPLNKVFLKNSNEAIWQLQPVQIGHNTEDANIFVLPPEGPSGSNPVYLNTELMKDLEPGDQRKIDWIGSVSVNGNTYNYPYKYKIKTSSDLTIQITEYNTVMRLAEQFLIRAEASANLNNLSDAISDVDQIRKRAGLKLIKDSNPNISKEDLIDVILKEKKVEFFTEWGHRWLDLKRTGRVDDVMTKVTPMKNNGGGWKSYQQYYPIWSFELQSNPNLTQTQGY